MKRLIALFAVLMLVLAACGGSDEGASDGPLVGDAAAGEEVYASSCASCHGSDGFGVEGLGKDLHNNEFVAGLTDEEFVEFLKEGRKANDPANETGVDMPPKGGNPSLSDQDLYDVAAFVRTLNG